MYFGKNIQEICAVHSSGRTERVERQLPRQTPGKWSWRGGDELGSNVVRRETLTTYQYMQEVMLHVDANGGSAQRTRRCA